MRSLIYAFPILAAFSLVFGEAPVVVSASPANGDQKVGPELKEITVVFDQPMAKGFSWIGVDSFVDGKPEWKDSKTCVLPVKLKAGTDYWLSINTDRFTNFRSESGEPAVPYAMSFRTLGGSTVPLSKEQNRSSIAELKRLVSERYSYRDRIVEDWDAEFRKHESALLGAEDLRTAAFATAKLFEVAKDMHIWTKAGDKVHGSYRRRIQRNYNQSLLPKLPGWKSHNNVVATASPRAGVKYILISTWSINEEADLSPALDFIESVARDEVLILDVRPNAGGSELMARIVAGCFLTKPVVYAKNRNISVDGSSRFTREFDRVVKPNSKRETFAGRKVVVLMGQNNMSSCEAFLLMMRQARSAVLVGEKSYGSTGNPKAYTLPNGVELFLPSWEDYDVDGEMIEGKGISPDVEVPCRLEDFQRQDPVLAKAISMALE